MPETPWSVYLAMVDHSRLQNYEKKYALGCVTGCLGCRWHRFQKSTEPATRCDLFWFWFLVVVTGFILFWFYYWILSANSLADLNWYAYEQLGHSLALYTILLSLTCAAVAYIILLDVLALCHIAVGQQLYIHWLHRIVLVIVLVLCTASVILVDYIWKEGWQLQHISLMITAPFLHVSAVAVMTFLTWFIAGWVLDMNFTKCHSHVSQVSVQMTCFGIYVVIMIGLYICPIFIRSPCISPRENLPTKPLVTAHKGASAISPENTVAAFDYATKYDVLVLESDVSVSFDGIPFILHDDNLRRTTDVDKVFPDMKQTAACWFNMSQLKQLDAGSWFIESPPFPESSPLSDGEKSLFRNQSIPLLLELLHVASQANASVMFDIKIHDDSQHCKDHPHLTNSGKIIVDTIVNSGFSNEKIWWLYHDKLNISTNFTKVGTDKTASPRELHSAGVSIVNFGYSSIFWDEISAYNEENISVNMYVVDSPWLFSLYWCMGVYSVTTNRCSSFYNVRSPVWHLTPEGFLALWLTTDVLSIAIVLILWITQKYRRNRMVYKMESVSIDSNVGVFQSSHTMKEKLLFCGEHGGSEPDIALSEVEEHAPESPSSSQKY